MGVEWDITTNGGFQNIAFVMAPKEYTIFTDQNGLWRGEYSW